MFFKDLQHFFDMEIIANAVFKNIQTFWGVGSDNAFYTIGAGACKNSKVSFKNSYILD